MSSSGNVAPGFWLSLLCGRGDGVSTLVDAFLVLSLRMGRGFEGLESLIRRLMAPYKVALYTHMSAQQLYEYGYCFSWIIVRRVMIVAIFWFDVRPKLGEGRLVSYDIADRHRPIGIYRRSGRNISSIGCENSFAMIKARERLGS